MAMTLQEQLARLSKRWRKNISEIPPDESIFLSLLSRCSYLSVSHGVFAAIRRYSRGGMDFDYAVKYMAQAALNKHHNQQATFKPPSDWI
jgi:hypothetical protein